MFDILQEILQCHPFLMLKKSKRKVANGTESNGLNLFSQEKGIEEKD